MIWTLDFWKGAGERAFKTLAQALLAVFVVGVPIFDVDVQGALAIAATAVVASLLTSVLNADFTAGSKPPESYVNYTTHPDGTVTEFRAGLASHGPLPVATEDLGDEYRDALTAEQRRFRDEGL